MRNKARNRQDRMMLSLFLRIATLVLVAGLGCGGDETPVNEGFSDRFDACERAVSLCKLSRDDLSLCVAWVEETFPNDVDRVLLVQCMMNTANCADMIETCNLDGEWLAGAE